MKRDNSPDGGRKSQSERDICPRHLVRPHVMPRVAKKAPGSPKVVGELDQL